MFKEIKKCRVCDNSDLRQVLDLGNQMLTGVFPKSLEQNVTSGPLKLVKCFGLETACGLLQLSGSYDLNEMYGNNYGYRSGLNASMVAHLHSKVKRILEFVNLRSDDLVIDIGSNDGTTLRAYPQGKFNLVGIDPTVKKFKEFYPSGISLIEDFFSADLVKQKFKGKKAKVVTSFSMFYDLDSPMQFMREIFEILDSEGVWVFEQSYLPSMLKTNSYDTVCHEHLEYYALKQIKWMAEKIGFKIVDLEFNDVNGGSFSVTVAKKSSKYREYPELGAALEQENQLGLDKLETYSAFCKEIEKTKKDLINFFDTASREGKKVFALGASTKGNVLLQYCGITQKQLPYIGEVNSEKFGCFTPGTYIPIISEDELLKLKPDYLLVLPWHFKSFFINQSKFKNIRLVFPLPKLEIV